MPSYEIKLISEKPVFSLKIFRVEALSVDHSEKYMSQTIAHQDEPVYDQLVFRVILNTLGNDQLERKADQEGVYYERKYYIF